MKAAVFVEPGKMEVREVARPGAVVGRVGVPHTGDINIGDYWLVDQLLVQLMTKKSC